mgnify:CR=1 FL=1
MNVETLVVGMLEVNCYIAWDEETKYAFVIDPGDEPQRIGECIGELGVKPKGILLTHGHVDHIRAVPGLAREYNIAALLHPDEHRLYFSPQNELPPWLPRVNNLPAPSKVPHHVPGLEYDVIHTPGHTTGGCCYYFPEAQILFSGDTLFCGSVGRTDLTGGDTDTLLKSIREKLLTLPPETVVYTGHGPKTTIGVETETNPFLNA